MKFNKRLIEAKETDPEFKSFMESTKENAFMQKWVKGYAKKLSEASDNNAATFGALNAATTHQVEPEMGVERGQTIGDAVTPGTNLQVMATVEVFNSVIRGFTRYMDDSFVRKYVTDSVSFNMPLVEYQELAGPINAGELEHAEKNITYATVNLASPESEKGCKVTWTRSAMEDVTFDLQAELMEGLGHAIAKMMMLDILKRLVGYANSGASASVEGTAAAQSTYLGTIATGGLQSITANAIAWSEFLAIIGSVDIGSPAADAQVSDCAGWTDYKTYGPADYALVSPDIYWQLLNIIQLTNVLYEGSTDPVKEGRIKLALGCTIVKQSLLPTGTIIALASDKALMLVTRRNLKIEPVVFPSKILPLIPIYIR